MIMGICSLLLTVAGGLALYIWGYYTGVRDPIVQLTTYKSLAQPKLILSEAGTILTANTEGNVNVYNPFPISASVADCSGDIYLYLPTFGTSKSRLEDEGGVTGTVNDVLSFLQGQDMSYYDLVKLGEFDVTAKNPMKNSMQSLSFDAPVSFMIPQSTYAVDK